MVKIKVNVIGLGVVAEEEAESMYMAKKWARKVAQEGYMVEHPDAPGVVAFVPPHLIGTLNMEEM